MLSFCCKVTVRPPVTFQRDLFNWHFQTYQLNCKWMPLPKQIRAVISSTEKDLFFKWQCNNYIRFTQENISGFKLSIVKSSAKILKTTVEYPSWHLRPRPLFEKLTPLDALKMDLQRFFALKALNINSLT